MLFLFTGDISKPLNDGNNKLFFNKTNNLFGKMKQHVTYFSSDVNCYELETRLFLREFVNF